MSNPSRVHTNANRDHKRAQFLGSGRPGGTGKKVLLGLILAAVVAGGYYLRANATGQATPAKPIAASPGPASVRIPIAEIDSGKAKFFDYKTAGDKVVRFFVMKSSDGVYRAALDTCDVCYQAKMGYSQSGDEMVCRKCSRRFPSAKINEVSGGCNPVGIPRTIAGGHLVIAANDLEAGQSFF